MTDYLLATMAKLGAIGEENSGVTFTSSEQRADTRNMSLPKLAAEIRIIRGGAPGIGRVITEELGSFIKRRIDRGRQLPNQK
jgi:hypothetical protein